MSEVIMKWILLHVRSLFIYWVSFGKISIVTFSGLAEFERDLIRMRTKAGLKFARARGSKIWSTEVNRSWEDRVGDYFNEKPTSA